MLTALYRITRGREIWTSITRQAMNCRIVVGALLQELLCVAILMHFIHKWGHLADHSEPLFDHDLLHLPGVKQLGLQTDYL